MEEKSNAASEIELLSKNQRKLLTVLARTSKVNAPLGRDFIQQTHISKATINQSLIFLEKKDYVFKDRHGYIHVLDPLIKAIIRILMG